MPSTVSLGTGFVLDPTREHQMTAKRVGARAVVRVGRGLIHIYRRLCNERGSVASLLCGRNDAPHVRRSDDRQSGGHGDWYR